MPENIRVFDTVCGRISVFTPPFCVCAADGEWEWGSCLSTVPKASDWAFCTEQAGWRHFQMLQLLILVF